MAKENTFGKASPNETLQLRSYGAPSLPTLVYLPGLHGDWTMIPAFRAAFNDRVRFVEITYPRSLTWTIPDYARGINQALLDAGITHGWLLGESFGSQPAWELKNLDDTLSASGTKVFHVEGIILAAGFVKHPLNTAWSSRNASAWPAPTGSALCFSKSKASPSVCNTPAIRKPPPVRANSWPAALPSIIRPCAIA